MTEVKRNINHFRRAFPEAAYMSDREIAKELRAIKEERRIIESVINGTTYHGCRIA